MTVLNVVVLTMFLLDDYYSLVVSTN